MAAEHRPEPTRGTDSFGMPPVSRRTLLLGLLAMACILLLALPARDRGLAAGLLLLWGIPGLLLYIPVSYAVGYYRREANATGKALAVAVIVVMGLVCTGIWSVEWRVLTWAHQSAEEEACLRNVHTLTAAMLSYAKQHEGKLPAAERWCDELMPYVHDKWAFVCPARRLLRSGYAYNRAAAGLRLGDIANADSLVLIFDSDRGWNAAGGRELLPEEPRHFRSDTYGFADGHVRRQARGAPLSWHPVVGDGER